MGRHRDEPARVAQSSALASKATGFPIAKIAAKLAVGYTLDEIPNDITRVTPASFEPTIDYVVMKIPRWTFEKFPQADRTLTTQMKSVGEAMAIGRTFKEAFLKGVRSLEIGKQRARCRPGRRTTTEEKADARCGGGWRSRPIAACGPSSALSNGAGPSRSPRAHAHRPVVPRAVRGAGRAAAGRPATSACATCPSDLAAHAKRAGFADARHRATVRDRRRRTCARGAGARPAPRLQARRHLRRGVRGLHAVPLLDLRARVRGRADADARR